MNIFVISPDPTECAQALDDQRLNKMVLETAQMLSTVMAPMPGLYKPTHAHHPVTLWVSHHTRWTYRLLVSLLAEYTYRRDREHGCRKIAIALLPNLFSIPPVPTPTEWCNCTPYPLLPVFDAYKLHLNIKWGNSSPAWTRRGQPTWRV